MAALSPGACPAHQARDRLGGEDEAHVARGDVAAPARHRRRGDARREHRTPRERHRRVSTSSDQPPAGRTIGQSGQRGEDRVAPALQLGHALRHVLLRPAQHGLGGPPRHGHGAGRVVDVHPAGVADHRAPARRSSPRASRSSGRPWTSSPRSRSARPCPRAPAARTARGRRRRAPPSRRRRAGTGRARCTAARRAPSPSRVEHAAGRHRRAHHQQRDGARRDHGRPARRGRAATRRRPPPAARTPARRPPAARG